MVEISGATVNCSIVKCVRRVREKGGVGENDAKKLVMPELIGKGGERERDDCDSLT